MTKEVYRSLVDFSGGSYQGVLYIGSQESDSFELVPFASITKEREIEMTSFNLETNQDNRMRPSWQ